MHAGTCNYGLVILYICDAHIVMALWDVRGYLVAKIYISIMLLWNQMINIQLPLVLETFDTLFMSKEQDIIDYRMTEGVSIYSCQLVDLLNFNPSIFQRIAETLDIEIKRWAAGKEGNLRALLSTLQYVCFFHPCLYLRLNFKRSTLLQK